MSKREVWHEIRTSSFLGGTYTAWCGFKSRKRDAQTRRLFGGRPKCPACQQAMKQAGRR